MECTHCQYKQKLISKYTKWLERSIFLIAIIGYAIALLAEFGIISMPDFTQMLLFVCCYFALGYGILKEAILGLIRREYFNENSLMTLASLGAFYVGDGAEAVAILVFYRVGEFLESFIVEKSKKQINSLSELKIENARILQENEQKLIPIDSIQKGDILVVFAGERILADGVVIKGESSVDNSALSGEAIPQSVRVGDKILSGGINLNGILHIKTEQSYKDSAFSKVLNLIAEGSAQKSKSEEFITKFAAIYTPTVTFLALCVAVIPPLYFWTTGDSFVESLQTWLYRGIIFLVVSCPCALVISIPLTFFAALGKASREGILIKGSSYLEALNSLGAVVFDKTGTITTGALSLKEIHIFSNFSKDSVLCLAKALESHSNHPIAKAILQVETLETLPIALESIKESAGGGITAVYQNENLALGNARFISEILHRNITETQDTKCEIFLSFKGEVIANFIFEDTIKESAKPAISKLNGLSLYILSGDKKEVAEVVAQEVGITNVFAPLLPEDKVIHLKEILNQQKQKGKKVAFVGDGINDAPSLALSDIGIAMGSGSDVALEGADIVIMHNDLQKIPQLLNLAHKTRAILWQNIVFALGVKVGIMLFGVFGITNLWIALFGDVGVALLALLNAIRAIR